MDRKIKDLEALRSENPEMFDKLMDEQGASERYEVYDRIDSEGAWKRFRNAHFAIQDSKSGHGDRLWRYLAAAAVLLCLVIAGIMILFRNGNPDMAQGHSAIATTGISSNIKHDVAKVPSSTTPMPSVKPLVNLRNAVSQAPMPEEFFEGDSQIEMLSSTDHVVRLEDGTTVWLNSGATLKYPTSFETDNRTVYLEGEAYFEVRSERGRPFYVRTASGIVKEYGTVFNVSASLSNTTVTLVEGRISVFANGGGEQTMQPGQQAVINASTPVAIVSDIDITNAIAWKTNIYKLENVTLADVAGRLQQHYGCKVVFNNKETEDIAFNGILNLNRNLSTILTAISFATGAKIRMTDTMVIFE